MLFAMDESVGVASGAVVGARVGVAADAVANGSMVDVGTLVAGAAHALPKNAQRSVTPANRQTPARRRRCMCGI